MTRRRRIWSIGLKALAILVVLLIYAAWPGRQTFTVSPETTYVTGPLDKDGYVDYVTALNERLSKGITPEDNANVLIWKALGPRPEGADMPGEYFKWLGIDPPPEQGEYFVNSKDYLKKYARVLGSDQREEFNYQLQAASNRPWNEEDFPEVADWIKRNTKPLAMLAEASRRSQYFNPLAPKQTEDWSPGVLASLLPTLQPCRDAARAFAARAMLRLRKGEADKAWRDLVDCWRLGQLVSRGGCTIEAMVGYAIDQLTGKTVIAYICYSNRTSKQLSVCANDILGSSSPIPIADKIDLGERLMMLDVVMNVIHQGTPYLEALGRESTAKRPEGNKFMAKLFTQSINWDPGFRNANRWYDRCAAATRLESRAEREKELAAIDHDMAELKQWVTATGSRRALMGPTRRGEWMGNLLLGLMLPAAQKLTKATDRQDQTQRNLRLAFALAAFHADNRRYPAQLEELATKYLDKIPNDLFSDKPLIYKPDGNGYLLYSVGPNGKDDEGRTTDDDPRGDDIAVRMPVQPPGDEK